MDFSQLTQFETKVWEWTEKNTKMRRRIFSGAVSGWMVFIWTAAYSIDHLQYWSNCGNKIQNDWNSQKNSQFLFIFHPKIYAKYTISVEPHSKDSCHSGIDATHKGVQQKHSCTQAQLNDSGSQHTLCVFQYLLMYALNCCVVLHLWFPSSRHRCPPYWIEIYLYGRFFKHIHHTYDYKRTTHTDSAIQVEYLSAT